MTLTKKTITFFFVILCLACYLSVENVEGEVSNITGKAVYRKPLPSLPITFNPKYYSDGYSVLVSTQIYDRLLVLDEIQNIKGGLVESWDVSNGGKVWIFHLRKNILFHDGKPLTSKDVSFSLHKLIEPDSLKSYELSIISGADDFMKRKARSVSGIKIIDPYTFSIELKTPFPPFLSILTGVNTEIIPDNYAGQGENIFFKRPIGTGPFKFVSFEQNREVVLEANDNYFLGKPYLEKIIFEKTDLENAVKGFNKNYYHDLEWFTSSDPNQIITTYTMIKAPVAGVSRLILNTQRPPFNNVHIRKALQYAIDKDQLVKMCFPSQTVAVGYIPPGVGGYYPELKPVSFDLEKAKGELKVSGLSKGVLSKPIMLYRPNNHPCAEKFSSFMVSSLKKIGLNVTVKLLPLSELYSNHILTRNYDIINIKEFADHPEAFFLLNTYKSDHPDNISGVKSKNINDLLDRAVTTADKYERFNLYRKIQEILQQEAIVIPLYYDTYESIYQRYVRGVERSPYISYVIPMRTIFFDNTGQL